MSAVVRFFFLIGYVDEDLVEVFYWPRRVLDVDCLWSFSFHFGPQPLTVTLMTAGWSPAVNSHPNDCKVVLGC